MNLSVPDPLSRLQKVLLEGVSWLFGGMLLFYTLRHFLQIESLQASMTQPGNRWLLLFGCLFSGVSFLALTHTSAKNRELLAQGILTEATVVDRWYEQDDGSTTYYLGYTFPEGELSKQLVRRKLYETTQIGDIVAVRYISGKSWRSRLEFDTPTQLLYSTRS